MSKRKTFNVLSIDGGGIRGIIPAMVLAEIKNRIDKPICELFDLIAGTSTGGILALGLSKKRNRDQQEQCTAQDLVNIYAERGQDIFKRSFWKGVSSVGGLSDEKYSHEGLENVLNEYFGEVLLHQTHETTRAMVTCYDIEAREPLFLKSWRDQHRSIKMKDAARATSAAPTYFEPTQICVESQLRTLIDGGVFINTPAVSAYAEARRIILDKDENFQHLGASDIFVVSLGTGKLTRRIPYEDARDWGKVEWLLPVLSCISDGMSDAANYQMERFIGTENYIRLQADLKEADDDMDNASDGNIRNLKRVANNLIGSDNFNRICDRLNQSEGATEARN